MAREPLRPPLTDDDATMADNDDDKSSRDVEFDTVEAYKLITIVCNGLKGRKTPLLYMELYRALINMLKAAAYKALKGWPQHAYRDLALKALTYRLDEIEIKIKAILKPLGRSGTIVAAVWPPLVVP